MAFSPDGGYLLAGGGYPVAVPDDEGVSSSILWNIKTGKMVQRYKVYGFVAVRNVAFTPNGRSAMSSAGPELWDVKSGKTIRKFGGRRDAGPTQRQYRIVESGWTPSSRRFSRWQRESLGYRDG